MTAEIQGHGARLVLLGHERAGKTTLLKALRNGPAPPSLIHEPTMLLDLAAVTLGDGPKQIILSIWDTAGDPKFHSGLQPYMNEGSLHVLAIPAIPESQLKAAYELYIGRFLKMLQGTHARAPTPD